MAYDKVVDSESLDSALTKTANAIRSKTGDADKIQWDDLVGFKEAVDGIKTEKPEQEKSVTPTKSAQTVTPSSGKVLSKVTVAAIPDAYQDVTKVTAGAPQVLVDYDIVDATGAVVPGTMPNNGGMDKTIDGLTVTTVEIPAGYTSGGIVSLTGDIEERLSKI